MRDYGEETKTIWGGDSNCKHKWITERTKRPNASGGKTEWVKEKLAIKGKENYSEFVDYNKRETKSDFCSLCGAWYGQLGLEPTLNLFLEHLLQITAELKRVLKKTGVMFWNMGDCYGGSGGSGGDYNIGGLREGQPKVGKSGIGIQPKCLALQNYRLILKMIDDQGWILRNSIIWNKPNHMPSSVKDRFSNAYESVFMLVKNKKYWFDLDAVRIEPRFREVWSRKGASPDTPYDQNNPRKRWGLTRKELFNYRVREAKKGQTKQDFIHKREGTYDDPLHQKAYDMKGKNPGDIWTIPTQPFPQAHFATFPEKLIRPMILAGCPEQICKKCGKARVRISKVEYVPHRKAKNLSHTRAKSIGSQHCAMDSQGKVCLSQHQTIGWTDCGCNAGWDKGIVLDPFVGSGTTCLVAKKLGCRWIGIDIKEEYCQMARQRINKIEESLF